MIKLDGMRIRHPGPWLSHDTRLKTLYPPDDPVRKPAANAYFADAQSAGDALAIDHMALLDIVWKIRSMEALATRMRDKSECARTRAVAGVLAAGYFDDVLSDISAALGRKAEAELLAEAGD